MVKKKSKNLYIVFSTISSIPAIAVPKAKLM